MSLQYPLSKEQYGNAMWSLMHSYTATLPEKLTVSDRKKFLSTFDSLVEHLPCQDCKTHARTYLKEHEVKPKTNKDLFGYMCDFHNHINSSQGKPVQDCVKLWESRGKECTTCSTGLVNQPGDKQETNNSGINSSTIQNHIPDINQLLAQSLKPSMEDFKNVSRAVIEKMCNNAGVAMPDLIFTDKTACSNPEMSCTHFPASKEEKTKIYLNINQYSPRTAIHEGLHYIARMKNMPMLALDETAITNGARQMVSRDFPMDAGVPIQKRIEVNDESVTPVTPASVNPWSNFKERSEARLQSFTQGLPYYSKYYHGKKKQKAQGAQVVQGGEMSQVKYSDGRPVYPQVVEPRKEPDSASEGFASMLDPVYAPFGQLLNLSARDVNIAHTPAILGNGIAVLAESNLNKFGSMVVSLLSAGITLAAGTLGKDSLGNMDKRILVGIGGALLWNGALRYIANPKTHEEVMEEAMEFGNSCSSWNVDAMVGAVTKSGGESDPEKELLSKGKVTESGGIRNISAPLGGQPRKVGRRAEETVEDIYENPDDTISSAATWRKPPYFPST